MAAVACVVCSRILQISGAVCGPNRVTHLASVFAAQEIDLTPDDFDRMGGSSHERPRYREHEVRRLLPMRECIEVMQEALAALARGRGSQSAQVRRFAHRRRRACSG